MSHPDEPVPPPGTVAVIPCYRRCPDPNCKIKQVKKEGANFERWFWSCQACDRFVWADYARTRKMVSAPMADPGDRPFKKDGSGGPFPADDDDPASTPAPADPRAPITSDKHTPAKRAPGPPGNSDQLMHELQGILGAVGHMSSKLSKMLDGIGTKIEHLDGNIDWCHKTINELVLEKGNKRAREMEDVDLVPESPPQRAPTSPSYEPTSPSYGPPDPADLPLPPPPQPKQKRIKPSAPNA